MARAAACSRAQVTRTPALTLPLTLPLTLTLSIAITLTLTLDMGRTWRVASRGLFVTKVQTLHIVDAKGDHVLVGVPGAVYESYDAAESWHLVNGSQHFGTCNTFKRGTIGEPYVV